ncbi:hypothetical protein BY996DRAFT_6408216 [Phakopsora pachyrhizi]|nr:hypothetical protein BY996DRAFT_6408216 [Phakopsora pachyrhizi]
MPLLEQQLHGGSQKVDIGMWYARVRAKAAKGRRIDASRDRRGKLPKAGTSGLRKDIAGPTTYRRANDVKGCTVTWGRYRRTDNARGLGGDVRIDNRSAEKGKNTLWRN